MTQEETQKILIEVKGFCERNINNRLSEDLCNALLGRLQAIMQPPKPQSLADVADHVNQQQHKGNKNGKANKK